MKILDTDHWIALLRGHLSLVNAVSPDEPLAITSISVGELIHGAMKSARAADNLTRLELLLATLTILPYDERAAFKFGLLKAQLEKKGMRLADLDLQIASIALVHDVPLVTHNTRHFQRIPELVLEDWLS